mgnify:CR=1 FL=1
MEPKEQVLKAMKAKAAPMGTQEIAAAAGLDVKIVENDLALLEEQRTSLQTTLENEISKIKEQNYITNFQIEEFNITPKRTDIYNIKLELLWQEQ